jgi:hypothetical protein
MRRSIATLYASWDIQERVSTRSRVFEKEFQALDNAAKELCGVGDEAAQKAFSDYFMEVSPVMFPAIFKIAGSARGLFEKVLAVLELDGRISLVSRRAWY